MKQSEIGLVENETFNTLKNQGYQLEHNFGHGTKNLSTVFATNSDARRESLDKFSYSDNPNEL